MARDLGIMEVEITKKINEAIDQADLDQRATYFMNREKVPAGEQDFLRPLLARAATVAIEAASSKLSIGSGYTEFGTDKFKIRVQALVHFKE